jgi:hypothetical protein
MKTINRNTAVVWAVAAALGGMIIGQLTPTRAQNIGDILKGGVAGAAILIAVDKFGPDIDKFVNKITGNKPGADSGESTNVVPILSVGRGTYAGAVQVSGPTKQVDQVKAVAQLEGQARIGVTVRAKVLIPISNRNVTDPTKLSRVKGVGIASLLDIKL